MKHEIPPASHSPERGLSHMGGGAPRRRGKKLILRLMVAASICVIAFFALFTVKPSWLAELKGRLPLIGAPTTKRSSARYPSRPVFKVVRPQRTNPLPPSTPPMMAEQMQRPQTSPDQRITGQGATGQRATSGFGSGSGISPSVPPSAYPVAKPHVSTPDTPGMPPAVPRALTYPRTRTDLSVPGAPGMSPPMSPPSVSPFPGEGESPPAISSSLPPKKKEESESDEYLEIATLYAQKGKYQKAEELFQKVAKENPSSAKAHNNLGVVRLKQEKYEMAEREFKEAMRIDPAFVLPYYNLACLYSRKGVEVDALIYLKRALKRDERVKQWVKTDKDFDRLRSDAVFQELVGGSPTKKEGATKAEGTQKPERVQNQDSVPLKEGSLKKEETSKAGTQTQEKAPHMGLQKKKEDIPTQSRPPQQVIPRQEEIQKQEVPQQPQQEGAQNEQGTQGSAPGGTAQ